MRRKTSARPDRSLPNFPLPGRTTLLLAVLVAVALPMAVAGVADAAARRCGTIRYDGFEARHIRSTGLPEYMTCASIRHVPEAWISMTGAALPDAARGVEFTALLREWDCFPTTGYYAAGRGAAAMNIKCGVWRHHRDGSSTLARGVWVRWQAWNL